MHDATQSPLITRRRLLWVATAVGVGVGVAAAAPSESAVAAPGTQPSWRYCKNCKGLFYNGHGGSGICTASSNGHNAQLSGNYFLEYDRAERPNWQRGWRHCINCQGLAFGDFPSGLCPAGGRHDHTGSNDYILLFGPHTSQQPDWAHCKRCQGLHYDPEITRSRCPAANRDGLPGNRHSREGSNNYKLVLVMDGS
jgi:hypothetical protein